MRRKRRILDKPDKDLRESGKLRAYPVHNRTYAEGLVPRRERERNEYKDNPAYCGSGCFVKRLSCGKYSNSFGGFQKTYRKNGSKEYFCGRCHAAGNHNAGRAVGRGHGDVGIGRLLSAAHRVLFKEARRGLSRRETGNPLRRWKGVYPV